MNQRHAGGERSMRPWRWAVAAGLGTGLFGCQASEGRPPGAAAAHDSASAPAGLAAKVAQYTSVRLTADLSALSERERRMIPLLIDAAAAMDTVYQQQYYPAKDSLLAALADPSARRLVEIN